MRYSAHLLAGDLGEKRCSLKAGVSGLALQLQVQGEPVWCVCGCASCTCPVEVQIICREADCIYIRSDVKAREETARGTLPVAAWADQVTESKALHACPS